MSGMRLRKVLRDLNSNKLRSLLAILAIAIGVFGIGSILTTYAILNYEITANFAGTNPPSAVLYVEGIDNNLAAAVENFPGVANAEPRKTIIARTQAAPYEWNPMKIYVIDDFKDLRVSTFKPEAGDWPPGNQEIAVERSSVSIADFQPGSTIVVKTPNGQPRELKVTGIVHDPGQAPGWQDHLDYGYVTIDTLKELGEPPTFNELHIRVAEDANNVSHITEVAYDVKKFIEKKGYFVSLAYIPEPGVHPHTDQMNSLLFLLEAFGILALVLSSILVANIVSALLVQQVRQIGIMKAIGGKTHQIASIYFSYVLLLGIGGLVIGIPLGTLAGRAYAEFTANMLNFNITSGSIPHWVFIVQILVGLATPLLSAALPILKGSRISVREAISDYGTSSSQSTFGTGIVDRLLAKFRGLDRPLLLSLRNTFRHKVRLILIIGILAMGGATFMSALIVSASWVNTIDAVADTYHYDLKVEFAEPYPIKYVEETIKSVPEVVGVESWNRVVAVVKHPDGTDGLRFWFTVVPPETEMVKFPVLQGRWLRENDTNALVINHELFYDENANIRLGDTIPLQIGNKTTEWVVVGIVSEVAPPKGRIVTPNNVFASRYYFNQIMNSGGMTNHARIQTTGYDADEFKTIRIETSEPVSEKLGIVKQKLEKRFEEAGLRIVDFQATVTRLKIVEDHLVVIIAFLLVMATLVVGVGGLALASVININIMERSREIGIMRSTGARTKDILRIFIVEAVIIGILSWLVAIILAYPLSIMVGNYAGWVFIHSTLVYTFPIYAVIAWLALIIFISVIASFYPAWIAAHRTIRELIAYE